MESIIGALAQMGVMGIMLAYMIFKENKNAESHKSERAEWHEASRERTDEVKRVVEGNTTAMNNHSNTLERLCDRIEHNQCKAK